MQAICHPDGMYSTEPDTQQELIESGVQLSEKDKHDKSIPLKHAKAAAEEHEEGHPHAARKQ